MKTLLSVLYVTLCVALISGCCTAVAGDHPLMAPFHIEKIRKLKGHKIKKISECPVPQPPVRDMEFYSYYTNRHGSKVDTQAYKTYKDAVKPLRVYEETLTRMANAYVASNPPEEMFALCALEWLDTWADEDAMLGEVNRTGGFVRKWMLASIASAYVQVKDSEEVGMFRRRRIENWLHKVARAVMKDYDTDTHSRSRRNNHVYWAGWAVGITAVALQDERMFDWAMGKALIGLGQVQEDGHLPLEVYRKSRALPYHLFSISPLVMLAELGAENGYDLYTYNNSALHRLIDLALDSLQHPEQMAKMAKAKQDMKKSRTNGQLGWLEPYHARFPDKQVKRFERYAEQFRPFRNSRMGGDLTLLFAPGWVAGETGADTSGEGMDTEE